jgi:hypothetical protein
VKVTVKKNDERALLAGRVETMRFSPMASNDFCTRDGALRLKERIEAYWRERGYDVNIELQEAGFMPALRSARTDVRSNMVNGMPRPANDRAENRRSA